MNKEQAKELDYGINMAVKALIEAMAMNAENNYRLQCGDQVAYTEKDFIYLIDKNRIGHNSVLERWEGK